MIHLKPPSFTLYEYRPSPFCVAVRIGLNECETTYTSREVDLKKPRTVAFLKRSPFGRLPALVEHRPSGELAIFESPAILLFLAERFPKSSIGLDSLASKAQCLSWLSFISSGLSEQIWRIMDQICKYRNEEFKKLNMKNLIKKLKHQMNVLEKHLARRAYLTGDYSIADALATPMLDTLENIKNVDLNEFPHILSWRHRLRKRPSYKNAWPYEEIKI